MKRIIAIFLMLTIVVYSMPENVTIINAKEKGKVSKCLVMGNKGISSTSQKMPKLDINGNIFKAELKEQDISQLESEGMIIENDIELIGCKTSQEMKGMNFDPEWNYKMINYRKSKKLPTGKNVKVAVMDSGIDAGNVKVKGYRNFVQEDALVPTYFEDLSGHGTSIAGVINDIAPESQIYSVKVMNSQNIASLSDVVMGIYWCIENDIDIINMSFGTNVKSEILQKAIRDASNAGILLIAAAGNNGNNGGVEYPAAFDEVMAVGAVDSLAQKTQESAVGEEIDLVAPGQQIVSEGLFGMDIVTGGTSMAVPHVAAVAAVIWSKDTKRTSEFVRCLLEQSANSFPDIEAYGEGLLDLEYALENYKVFSKVYKKENKKKRVLPENIQLVEGTEVGFVEGRWSNHSELVNQAISGIYDGNADDLKKIKAGAILPDKSPRIHGGVMPQFHGGGNYIANTIAVTRLAVKGNSCKVESISTKSAEVSGAKNVLQALKSLTVQDWSQIGVNQIPNDSDLKLYYYGIAIHIATDALAHHSYYWRDNAWKLITHTNGADNPNTQPTTRYLYAKHIAYRIVRAYKAGHQASYKTFIPDDNNVLNSLRPPVAFKVANLKPYAYRVNNGTMSGDQEADSFLSSYSYYIATK